MTTPSLIKNTFWLYLFSYIAAPLGYLTRLIISHDISIEEVGILYSLLGFIGILSSYSGLGIIEALKYFIPKLLLQQEHSKLKSIILISFLSQIAMSSLLGLFLYFGADRLANYYFKTTLITGLIPYYIIYLFGANILQLLSSIFFGFQDSFSGKIMDFLMSLFILLFTVSVATLQAGNLSIYLIIPIISLLLSVLVGLFLYIFKHYHKLHSSHYKLTLPLVKEFFNYSIWTFLTVNINILLNTIDQQLVLLLSGAFFAGLYTNYISLQNLSLIIVSPIAMLLTPIFTTLITQKSFQKLKTLLNTLYTNIGGISIAISSFLFVFGPQIAQIFFGTAYQASGLLFRYTAPFYIFTIFASFNFTLLAADGKIKQRTLSLLKVVPIYLILSIILTYQFAIYGTIIAGIISKLLIFFITYHNTQPFTPHIERKKILKIGILSLVLALLLYLVESQFHLTDNSHKMLNFLAIACYGLLHISILMLIFRKSLKQLYQILKSQ